MTFSSIAIEVGRASTAQTHPITIRESMGFQWALSFATLPITGGWMGYPCDWQDSNTALVEENP